METTLTKNVMILGAVLNLVPLMHCARVYPQIKTLLIQMTAPGEAGASPEQRKNLLTAWSLSSDELLASSAAAAG